MNGSSPSSWQPTSTVLEDGAGSSSSPQFSLGPTIILTLIFCGCFGLLIFIHVITPRLNRVSSPEEALGIVANQILYLKAGLERAPEWERGFNETVSGSHEDLKHLIQWYTELAARSPDPLIQLYLAVLEAENGERHNVRSKAVFWEEIGNEHSLFSKFLAAAYWDAPDKTTGMRIQSQLAELVPDNWFYYQLAGRIARQMDDERLAGEIHTVLAHRGETLVERNFFVSLIECGVAVGGCLALILVCWKIYKQGWQIFRVGETHFPPPWPGSHGGTVLLRGGGIAAILLFLISLTGLDPQTLQLGIPFILHVPILLWASRYLFAPYGLTAEQAFGLRIQQGGWIPCVLVTGGILVLGLGGNWVMGMVAHKANVSIHWTDWFDPTLVEGDALTMMATLFGYVILSPVLEELVFRGILFSTLRRKFSAWPAIFISAGLFAAAHGYGMLGGLTIFWSGILWAWAYEKTGSLWPGMVAHGVNNFLVCLSVVMLIRPA